MSTDYAALANTIKIEDITSNELNREILHKLKNNDKSFDKLYFIGEDSGDGDDYIPDDGEDLGWLGYFIGQNTKIQELSFYVTIDNESFYKEMSRNKSIKEIHLYGIDSLNGKVFHMLTPFFESNNNLTIITVEGSEYRLEGARQLSLAIGSCSKSLKHINISHYTTMEIGQLVNIITALSMHPQLEVLDLPGMSIGRNECTALSTLLRCTTTQLQELNLSGNDIDDEGVKDLVNVLSNGHKLRELGLSSNRSITITGWKAVSILLETPDTKLETLNITHNHIGNEGALVFAKALTNNSSLNTLGLYGNGITLEGWEPFSKLLCDTSSINNTHRSNHTLTSLGTVALSRRSTLVDAFLRLNGTSDKGRVAMQKILQNHSHFNMHPFFEWEFKVLPIMVEWFTKAAACTTEYEEKIKKMKLSVIYDFIKEFPMLYVEAMTKQEIAKYAAMEEELQDKLKEIRKRKAHAMRRLD